MVRRRGAGKGRDAVRRGPEGPTPGSDVDLTPNADPYSIARAIVVQQLTAAPRTRAQLADTLARRGVPEGVAETVLDRMEQVQLVDDEAFAQMWVRSRHTGRGLARSALAHELRDRGVEDEIVRAAVGEVSPEDELLAARELVRRRLPSTVRDDPARRSRRLASMLVRKGYGPAVIQKAIRETLAVERDPAPGGGGYGCVDDATFADDSVLDEPADVPVAQGDS